jgi:antitoxin component YwqK of YwqJK toxin-antitoxin module
MQRVPENKLRYDDVEGVYYLGDQPFTGVAYTQYPDGSPMSESEYRDGVFSGVSRGWSRTGSLESESHYLLGALHGKSRQWHTNGQLAEDEDHEYGILVRGKKWDEAGNLTEDFELKESDPAYKSLLRSRAAYGNQPPRGS